MVEKKTELAKTGRLHGFLRASASSGRVCLEAWARTHSRLGKPYLGLAASFHVPIVKSRLT